jgi:hypothetical protein
VNLRALLTFLVVFLFAGSAAAEPVRILIAAGNKNGLAEERPLKFADNDAKRVRDVMTSLGGVKPEHAFYLSEPSRASLYDAIAKAKAEAQRHIPAEVTLIFYFSGHGDRDAIHLSGERVLVSDLSAKLGEVPASLRIAVTDACRATRDKGFAADEPFAISTTVNSQAVGQVWLHASSDGEVAQESDELQGAIFTNAWLSGLRGAADSNGDARVTLDESFAFAHSQTLIRSSKSSGVAQKPEAVINLHEAAPVVMTQTGAKLAMLRLPPARDTHFLVYSASAKSVLSEVWGAPDRALVLRVPPGRYVVQRRIAGNGAIATIAIGEGEERRLAEGDFSANNLEALAAKGGFNPDPDTMERLFPNDRPNELSVGWDVGADGRTGFMHGPRIGYTRAWHNVALVLGGGMTFSDRETGGQDESLRSTFGRAAFELRVPIGTSFLFRADLGGRAGVLSQTLSRTNETRNAFTGGPELAAALRWNMTRAVFLDLSATGDASFFSYASTTKGVLGATSALALGVRF